VTATINSQKILMHIYIMNVLCNLSTPENKLIDHKNHKRWDNRISNLRFLTTSQNAQNRPKKKTAKSKFRGVSVSPKASKPFIAKVRHNKKTTHIGFFYTEEEAAEAFDRFVAHHENIKTPMNEESKRDQYQKDPLIYPKKRYKKEKYIGVYPSSNTSYRARFKKDGKSLHVGTFKTAIEAAHKYDEYIVRNKYGNKLNFPELYPDYSPPLKIKTRMIKQIDEDTVQISINGKNSNDIVLIDKEDYEKIKHCACHINNGYVNIYIWWTTFKSFFDE